VPEVAFAVDYGNGVPLETVEEAERRGHCVRNQIIWDTWQ
jgi:hypothetical protein